MLPIFKIVGTAIRGIAKGIPAINAIVETVRNIKAKKAIDTEVLGETVKGDVAIKLGEDGQPTQPHNWVSIIFQYVTVAVVLYAFFTKQITAESVINLLKSLGGF